MKSIIAALVPIALLASTTNAAYGIVSVTKTFVATPQCKFELRGFEDWGKPAARNKNVAPSTCGYLRIEMQYDDGCASTEADLRFKDSGWQLVQLVKVVGGPCQAGAAEIDDWCTAKGSVLNIFVHHAWAYIDSPAWCAGARW